MRVLTTARVPITVALGLVLVLTGCTASGQDTASTELPTTTYVEPAWMADSRQDQEKDATDMAACLTQAGWETRVTPDWGTQPAQAIAPDQWDAYDAAASACSDSLFGDLPERTEEEWRVKYAHALDTRDCLAAHGYSISDPPSEDSWVQAGFSGGTDLWVPFAELFDQAAEGLITLDDQAYYELFAACTQDGPIAGRVGG